MRPLPLLVAVTPALVALSGRVWVSATERDTLTSPGMPVGLGEDGLARAYPAKRVESRTGGGLPGSAPGGGCGCAP